MSLSYEELEARIVEWAKARQIIPNSNPTAQLMKTMSELGELADGTLKGNAAEIEDGVGDVLVTLILYCALQGISVVDCLGRAYDEIKDRKGQLTPAGVFVKETVDAALAAVPDPPPEPVASLSQNAEPLWLVVEGRFDKGFKLYGPFNTEEEAENFGWSHCGQYEWWYERLTPPAGPIASDPTSDEPQSPIRYAGRDIERIRSGEGGFSDPRRRP